MGWKLWLKHQCCLMKGGDSEKRAVITATGKWAEGQSVNQWEIRRFVGKTQNKTWFGL